jgi:hypothetical protein
MGVVVLPSLMKIPLPLPSIPQKATAPSSLTEGFPGDRTAEPCSGMVVVVTPSVLTMAVTPASRKALKASTPLSFREGELKKKKLTGPSVSAMVHVLVPSPVETSIELGKKATTPLSLRAGGLLDGLAVSAIFVNV